MRLIFDGKWLAKPMLIVIAHGSRNPAWRASVERQIDALQADVGADALQLAYMELSPPTLTEVVAEAAQRGINKIRVMPLFLAQEGHVDKDIRPAVDQVRTAFGSIEIELLPPLGQHPLFRELLRSLAAEETPKRMNR
jgi:sirohydrochlorin cobaltochelatase